MQNMIRYFLSAILFFSQEAYSSSQNNWDGYTIDDSKTLNISPPATASPLPSFFQLAIQSYSEKNNPARNFHQARLFFYLFYEQEKYKLQRKKEFDNTDLREIIVTCYYLGCMYEMGQGGERNRLKAKELLNISADLGHIDAQYQLAMIYKDEGSYQKHLFLKYISLASKNHHPEALAELIFFADST